MSYATSIVRFYGISLVAVFAYSNAQADTQAVEVKKHINVLTDVTRQVDVLAQCVNPPTTAPADKATQQNIQRARTAELSSRIA